MGWIGVDLDGTLAEYHGWRGPDNIGEPVPLMLERVKQWLAHNKDVRIFTARVSPESCTRNNLTLAQVRDGIWKWCDKHLGRRLPITCEKDLAMEALWDDRATQVVENLGLAVADQCELLADALRDIQGYSVGNPVQAVDWMQEQAREALEDVHKVPVVVRSALRQGHEQALLELRQAKLTDFADAEAYAMWVQDLARKALMGV